MCFNVSMVHWNKMHALGFCGFFMQYMNKMAVRPAKTQISLGIRPVWSESSLSTWRKLGSLATHWAQSEDSEQTGRMPRLLVLSCRGSVKFAIILLVITVLKMHVMQNSYPEGCNSQQSPHQKDHFQVWAICRKYVRREKTIHYSKPGIIDLPVEPPRNKTNKMTVRPAKTQISLGVCPVWSDSSLCA